MSFAIFLIFLILNISPLVKLTPSYSSPIGPSNPPFIKGLSILYCNSLRLCSCLRSISLLSASLLKASCLALSSSLLLFSSLLLVISANLSAFNFVISLLIATLGGCNLISPFSKALPTYVYAELFNCIPVFCSITSLIKSILSSGTSKHIGAPASKNIVSPCLIFITFAFIKQLTLPSLCLNFCAISM